MNEEQALQLLYFSLLGLFVGSYFFFDAGQKWGETARNALVWLCIFMAVIMVYGQRDLLQNQLMGASQSVGNGSITLTRSFDGHFYAELLVNGKVLDFVVDTGASQVVLSRADAEKVGFKIDELRYWGRANTANGEVRTAPVRLDNVIFGNFKDTEIEASVNGGELQTSLLGMSYLSRFEAIEIRGNKMTLYR